MGTVLKEQNRKIKSSASRYSLLVISATVLGISLLLFQAYSIYTGKSFKAFNFDIGTLWNADDNSQVNLPIEDEDIILQVIPQSRNLAQLTLPVNPADPTVYLAPKRVKDAGFVSNAEIINQTHMLSYAENSMNSINLLSIPVYEPTDLAFKYMQQLQNEYLINPNLEGTKADWYVGFSFGPSINYRTLKYSNSATGIATVGNTRYTYGMTESFRNQTDKAISSYYTGLDVGYNISDRLSINSGVYYSVYGESISVSTLNPNDVNAKDASYYGQTPLYSSPDNELSTEGLTFENRYSYVELPLFFNYIIRSGAKTDIALQLGAYLQKMDHVNALIYDFNTDYYYWLPQNDIEIYAKYGVGSMGGISISQFVSNSVEVFFNPQFKFNVSRTFDDCYPIEQKQYASGLRLGVRQHLVH